MLLLLHVHVCVCVSVCVCVCVCYAPGGNPGGTDPYSLLRGERLWVYWADLTVDHHTMTCALAVLKHALIPRPVYE